MATTLQTAAMHQASGGTTPLKAEHVLSVRIPSYLYNTAYTVLNQIPKSITR